MKAYSLLNKLKSYCAENKRKALIVSFSFICMFSILVSFVFSGAKIACRVNYFGRDIATAKSEDEVNEAINTVQKMVNGKNVKAAIVRPQCTTVITIDSQIDSKEDVVNAIIENNSEIVKATAVFVNGKKEICAESENLFEKMDKRLHSFDVEGVNCSSEFVDFIEYVEDYYLKEELSKPSDVDMLVSGLNVRTYTFQNLQTPIPYSVVTQRDATKALGYKEVLKKGTNGISQTYKTSVFVNGVLESENSVPAEVILDPVSEVVCVGTATPSVSESAKYVFKNGYNFPLPSKTWEVSAYFGDGRGHKGVDLRAPKGTAIMAVSGGTVVYAAYKSGYGYMIDIDHGNNVVTRYAHASALCVSKGETVSAGQVIATVGSSGNATGNHLHFEVLINGKNVNPAPYIGLK